MTTFHRRVSKFAAVPVPSPGMTPVQAQQIIDAHWKKRIGHTLLAGLGAGAGVRGLLGVARLINRGISDFGGKPKRSPSPTLTPLPLRHGDDEFEKEAKTPYWALPAAGGAGTAGFVGGWKALDMLLERRRLATVQKELDEAKEEFEQALLGQSKLGQALDRIYDDMVCKSANVISDKFNKVDWGKYIGLYLLYAGLSGAYGIHGGYQFAKDRSPQATFDEAAKLRRYRIAHEQQQPILFEPRAQKPKKVEKKEEEEQPAPDFGGLQLAS